MNIATVCLLVGLAISVNCLCVFWLVRSYQAKHAQQGSNAQPIRRKPTKASVRLLYSQAGYQNSVAFLYLIMAGLVVGAFAIGRFFHIHPLISGSVGIFGALCLPQMHLRHRRERRQRAFIQQLPNALELMANGL